MITLPLFFLSNMLLTAGASLSGCAAHPDFSALHEQSAQYTCQKGSMTFASSEDSSFFKLRFEYYQVGPKAYAMTLYPFLMNPISVSLHESGEMTLVMNGVVYSPEESIAMLDAYAPEFPWDNLAQIVVKGTGHNAHWTMESWSPSYFRMHYAGNTMEWIADPAEAHA